jgi:hypothetical protein
VTSPWTWPNGSLLCSTSQKCSEPETLETNNRQHSDIDEATTKPAHAPQASCASARQLYITAFMAWLNKLLSWPDYTNTPWSHGLHVGIINEIIPLAIRDLSTL